MIAIPSIFSINSGYSVKFRNSGNYPDFSFWETIHCLTSFKHLKRSGSILQLKGCIVWNDTIQYTPKRSAIRAQAAQFRHSTMISVTWLRLNDISVICCVDYFQFPIQSAFLPHISRQAAPALRRTICFNTQYRTSSVAENLYRYLCCAERITWGKDFELILTVQMETRWKVLWESTNPRESVFVANTWQHLPHLLFCGPLVPNFPTEVFCKQSMCFIELMVAMVISCPVWGANYCDPRISVCLCRFVGSHIAKITCPNFTQFSVYATCGHGSVPICYVYTSGFVDDVMFP